MKKLFEVLGKASYYLILPVLIVVIRFTKRSRIVVVCDDKILVVKGWLGRDRWILPGGGIHKNEKPELGAKRELKEETGIDVQANSLQLVSEGKYSRNTIKYHYYLYEMRSKDMGGISLQKHEIRDYAWINPKDIDEKSCSRDLIFMVNTWKNKGKFAKIN